MRLALTSRDCAALMPDGGPDAQARVKALESELATMESELAEADAQHRLYSLLKERTRYGCPPYSCTPHLAKLLSCFPGLHRQVVSFGAVCSGRTVTGILLHESDGQHGFAVSDKQKRCTGLLA